MCGITGLIHKSAKPVEIHTLQKMARALTHRGPDDEGYFVRGPVGLGHRRLSIIDIGGGHQPMASADGRYQMVFNGEIYNFLEIRKKLEMAGHIFTSHSDSEVLLKLYTLKKEKALADLNGMFAFAIWDNHEKKLFAARDRMGKKPFYYWDNAGLLAFASECKAFLMHPDFSAELDYQALAHYFQYEFVPAPYCIFKGVKKLPAAHYLEWDSRAGLTIKKYWDVPLSDNKTDLSEGEAQDEIIRLLDRAVQYRLVSDVPLGVFLSGGLDSSAVVAMMARHKNPQDIKTFSIGFAEKSYDETGYANVVAKKFGTNHHEQILTPHKLQGILPEVAHFLDEPFADYSIIPTTLLSKFTRQHVTVALGGDGGDELFAGYPTFYASKLASLYRLVPSYGQKLFSKMASLLPASDQDMSFEFKLKQFLYGAAFPPVIRNQIWLGAFHFAEQQRLFANPAQLQDPLDLVWKQMADCESSHPGDRMLYFYQKFYLCDDILVKADRASMAASLEVRAPFLDHNFVEFVSRLPYRYKLRGTQTKNILKKSLENILPHDIIYRPKKGFGIPLALWLKNELKDQLLRHLDPQKIKKEGIFNPGTIQQLVQQHLSGRRNNRKQLFSLLMFELWRDKYLS